VIPTDVLLDAFRLVLFFFLSNLGFLLKGLSPLLSNSGFLQTGRLVCTPSPHRLTVVACGSGKYSYERNNQRVLPFNIEYQDLEPRDTAVSSSRTCGGGGGAGV
jgi:hypothetical protein